MTNQENQTQFMIQRVYVKGLSFETMNTPAIFQDTWEPELSLDVNTQHNKLENNIYEVILSLTATVLNKKTTAFLVEVQQAGIFTIQGAPAELCRSLLFHPDQIPPRSFFRQGGGGG